MKITSIKLQVKNPERTSIFVDGKYGFSLSLGELVHERLKMNQELSQSRLTQLKKISADGKLKARAMEWTLNRPHSVREFHDYLRRKKVDVGLVEKLTSDFLERNYLNEENFTRWLVDVRGRGSKSNRAIRAELTKKGITRELADGVLGNLDNSEEARLQDLVSKKSKLLRYQKSPQKLFEYLARQGFDYELIKNQLKISKDQ